MPDATTPSTAPRVALIGFGEAGEAFARSPEWSGDTRAWDILPARRSAMAIYGVKTADNAAAALADRAFVLSLVTADAQLDVARDYAQHFAEGALWCDMNSVSPDKKRAAAQAVYAVGGRYVDVAVMAPVNPAALNVPLLLSGAHALAAQPLLEALGFSHIRIVGDEVGRASAIKMIRSVMVKGTEALSAECAAAADAAGVFDEVMASLDASENAAPWADKVAYNRERMAKHGLRRAAEMEESAQTLLGLGVDPVMTRGTIACQRSAAKDTSERTDAA